VARYAGAQPLEGTFRLKSRHILHKHNWEATRVIAADLAKLDGLVVTSYRFSRRLRRVANVEAVLPRPPAHGLDGIVLVTAHLDSTAKADGRYSAEYHAAAGADDDASGVAGVLAAAAARSRLAGLEAFREARREIRFVLFTLRKTGTGTPKSSTAPVRRSWPSSRWT
jgi:hypothetical protein